MTTKPEETPGNLCTWCNERYTSDPMYWKCDECAEKQKPVQHHVYHLPGNP